MLIQKPLHSIWMPSKLPNKRRRDVEFCTIQVGNVFFKVHTPTLLPASPVIARQLQAHLPTKRTVTLQAPPPPSPRHFEAFLTGVYRQSIPRALQLVTIEDMILIAEMSLNYENKAGAAWAMEGIRTSVDTTQLAADRPLRRASPEVFMRILQLFLVFPDAVACESVQSQWLSRLFRRELPPAQAIDFAWRASGSFDHLLKHALYVYMVRIQSGEQNVGRLSREQALRVTCGYHSLRVYAGKICMRAPRFRRSRSCLKHNECMKTWRMCWALTVNRPSKVPRVDLLQRLKEAHGELAKDPVIAQAMHEGCRKGALKSVARTRAMISNHLHHHFDL